ncbi:MAG TPA: hypothetical protein PLZ36_04860, partial [Armatimonadota bacterium]|nr:hypothetical protein [Armatimonadota bacterium]
AQSVVTVDAGVGNLRIQPVAPFEWEIELVRGREGPDFQGWYSPEMDVRLPNTCAIYAANLPRTATFAWLLLPGNGAVPACSVTAYDAPEGAVHLRLDIPGQAPLEIAVRLDEALPLRLTSGEMLTAPCAVRPAEGR